jgi:hypothetical protein
MSNRSTVFSEATLVRRINRALAGSGLRVRTARRGSLTADLAGRHYIVYGTRTFRLRVGIEELASSLGIRNQVESAEAGLGLDLNIQRSMVAPTINTDFDDQPLGLVDP